MKGRMCPKTAFTEHQEEKRREGTYSFPFLRKRTMVKGKVRLYIWLTRGLTGYIMDLRAPWFKHLLVLTNPKALYIFYFTSGLFFMFFLFCFFRATPWHMEVPRLGVKSELQQPAYTTAHSNTRSLTHWARPAIKTASSWILVRFVSTEAQWKLISGFSRSSKLLLYTTSSRNAILKKYESSGKHRIWKPLCRDLSQYCRKPQCTAECEYSLPLLYQTFQTVTPAKIKQILEMKTKKV